MINIANDKLEVLSRITGRNVSRETLMMLEEFALLLLKWNQKINLVSKKIDKEELWNRHILDSAQLIKYIPVSSKNILDFGSGAGFPGLILAIIGGYEVNLIEGDQRKCAFMQVAASRFALQVNIINARIEGMQPILSDVVTSRALAELNLLFEYSYPHLKKNNFMLFLKGQNVVEEIKEATTYWDFEHNFNKCSLGGSGGVLEVNNVKRR